MASWKLALMIENVTEALLVILEQKFCTNNCCYNSCKVTVDEMHATIAACTSCQYLRLHASLNDSVFFVANLFEL